jgi:3-dehydroquinate synthase
MPPSIIPVRTPTASYDIELAPGLLPQIGTKLAGKRVFVITSPEIDRLHGPALDRGFTTPPPRLLVPAGEQHKRLATVERLLEELAHNGADRDSILLAFGGGVLGDMTGFLAATYMRGIPYIQIPTTALAQIDSSIGGKTGVNLAAGKNLAGAFYHPLAVYADIDTLATLPPAELRAGLQEAVKAGIIRDAALFTTMERNAKAVLAGDPAALTEVIAAAILVKAKVVAADERESGERMLLNLGHTLGHAIEAATHYKQLLHGEAVAWGMIAATSIAAARGTVTPAEAARINAVIRFYGPLKPFTADPAQLVALTANDKKNRSGTRSFILPVGIGDATVVRDITESELLTAATTITTEAKSL